MSSVASRLAFCVFALGLRVGVATAQPDRVDSTSAESLHQEGRKLFDEKLFDRACPKFEASVQLDPDHLDSRGMLALCYELTKKYASAWTTFREVRVRAQRANRADIVNLAEEHITILEPKLAKLTLSRPASANVTVRKDGFTLPSDGLGTPLAIDAGKHTIVAEQTGFKPWSQEFEIADGEQKTIDIPALEALPPEAKPNEPPSDPTTFVSRPSLSTPRWVAIGAVGLGVVAFGIGTWAGLDARASRDDARSIGCNSNLSMCDNPVALSIANDAYSRGKHATGFFIGSAVLVGAAAVIWFVVPERESSAKTATWKIQPSIEPKYVGLVFDRSL